MIRGGTAGYIVIEQWGVWDAFYMTIITLTTVGYRDVHTLPPSTCSTAGTNVCSRTSRIGVIVVGIQRQDGRMDFNPDPEVMMRAGDKLVVLGRPESLKRLEARAAEAT
jgi:hypothetical protein